MRKVFHIAYAKSGTCLKDAGAESETVPFPILTDFLPSGGGPESESTHLWRLVALMARGPAAAANLTSIGDKQFSKFARPAMELLISQWEESTISNNPKKSTYQVVSIDQNGINTLKKSGHNLSKKRRGDSLKRWGSNWPSRLDPERKERALFREYARSSS
ncbi:uncharacterized protein BDW43DRAFT_306918 [Aspergillus alliaceus]|uniref:uncharacterized protein n=1 Tax=Petromyces alliaceus TaxID=209559 RepID=UPI0012A44888|nr:uncharacterized protein BDW43DRAFT_306918 [Aspergillus alliaceus]KAB8238234.1 hypothetical protein BDW43DRAFT_306918 [Aspergillus alliaceus]